MTGQGAAELSRQARRLYRDSHGPLAWIQILRPYICPYEELIPLVPPGARVLDVGCGAGLFLGLLAEAGRISGGSGFDASARAIRLARKMRAQAPLAVEQRDAVSAWPGGQFDVVCLIDVLHHVPPAARPGIVRTAAEHMLPHGLLLYKDMVERPHWRAWCNQMHDLVLARQWVRHVPTRQVDRWAGEAGLQLVWAGSANRLWYGHEWRTYRRA